MRKADNYIEKLIRQQVVLDEMQFCCMLECGTANANFLWRELQWKYLAKKNNLYFPFEDLEKAFDHRVPRNVIW